MELSVVLPCYNEEQNAAASVRDVWQWMQREKIDGEIIAVDDGSKDGTKRVLQDLTKAIPVLRTVLREKNGGYGIAVRAGCDSATKEWIAFMDSDRQFRADDLSKLIAFVGQYPFVTGRRRKRADPLMRKIFGKLLAMMNVVVLGLWVHDVNCGMKMFQRAIWKNIRPEYGVEKLFNTEMFLRLKVQKIPWKQVMVEHYPRRSGAQTGGSPRVIARMFLELFHLRRSLRSM